MSVQVEAGSQSVSCDGCLQWTVCKILSNFISLTNLWVCLQLIICLLMFVAQSDFFLAMSQCSLILAINLVSVI